MDGKLLVSVVIPTFNSERYIEKCLQSVRNQTYDNIEIIVVDKDSGDRTVEIAEKYAKVFVINAKERSEQMNFGVKKAKGQYVYIVGSDFILEPKVVEEAAWNCENDSFDAVCVHNTSDPTISFWSKVRKFERDMYRGDELNVAARFFRKNIFKEVGGFDETLVAAEDYDLHNRLLKRGFKIGKINAVEVHIGEPRSLREIAQKHYYYGKTIEEFIKKNPERGKKQLKIIRPAFIKHGKEFVKHPILTSGFLAYQVVRYFSAGSGYLVAKVRKDE